MKLFKRLYSAIKNKKHIGETYPPKKDNTVTILWSGDDAHVSQWKNKGYGEWEHVDDIEDIKHL